MLYKSYLDENIPSLNGKNIVITGANSGIGFSSSLCASYKGANVFLACRNALRAENAIKKIKDELPNSNPQFMEYDQASFESIKNFANNLKRMKVDVLVLNAGILRPGKNLKTKDGFPLTCGTNYLGVFYLLDLLNSQLQNNRIGKIIIVTSLGRIVAPRNYIDYLYEDKNHLFRAYFSSKKMLYELAGNLKSKYPKLDICLMHPGIAVTGMVNNTLNSVPNFLHSSGSFILRIIANDSEKSSLCLLKAISVSNTENIYYVYPRGLFHAVGFPKTKLLDENKIKSSYLEATSYNLINTI